METTSSQRPLARTFAPSFSRNLPPPLPDPVPDLEVSAQQSDLEIQSPLLKFRTLRHGCYLIRYTPLAPIGNFPFIHYDGTIRVQRDGENTIASGDLYLHQLLLGLPSTSKPGPSPPIEPNPGNGIPIFPITRYRYYVRITQILENKTIKKGFTLGFELHQFDHKTGSWTGGDPLIALMQWSTAPTGFPVGSDYLTGQVRNGANTVIGNITMGWVSAYLRRATVEIDRVPESESPLSAGPGLNWQSIFDLIGWHIDVIESSSNVSQPSGESWSNAELHAAMLQWRDSADLNSEWRYHALCVRLLDDTPRGIMYDAYATDSNNVPREGIGISSHWIIPNETEWGLVQGKRFGTVPTVHFRTALHEVGHAMGLYHNTVDMGIMNTTDTIAASASPPTLFPNNIKWSHAPDDQKRLRHMPDIWVRPGGIAFGSSYSTSPISPDDLNVEIPGLKLQVSPLMEIVPIGAPVRVNFQLLNTTNETLVVPRNLTMKGGHTRGKVIDPSGVVRTFSPIILCIDEEEMHRLGPKKGLNESITLLRGAQGALFPTSGTYKIIVDVTWETNGLTVRADGETTIMVTPAKDESHAKAAHKILSTPDAVLTLALGGDHLKSGVEAIKAGLEDGTLRDHYAFIEAKRLGKRFGKRKPDLKAASNLINKNTIMTPAEIKRAVELVRKSGKDESKETTKRIAGILKDKLSNAGADDETTKIVKSL
jgi:hypothetical protein